MERPREGKPSSHCEPAAPKARPTARTQGRRRHGGGRVPPAGPGSSGPAGVPGERDPCGPESAVIKALMRPLGADSVRTLLCISRSEHRDKTRCSECGERNPERSRLVPRGASSAPPRPRNPQVAVSGTNPAREDAENEFVT